MNRRILKSFKRALALILSLAIATPTYAFEYCPPPEMDAPENSDEQVNSPAEETRAYTSVQRGLLLTSQRLAYRVLGTQSLSQDETDILELRRSILNFIPQLETDQDTLVLDRVLGAYNLMLRRFVEKELAQKPGSLKKLDAYRERFGLEVPIKSISKIFPTRKAVYDEYKFYPGSRDTRILALDEMEVLRLAIRGLGTSNKPVAEKYLQTAKCLLSATQMSKMAFNHILRGRTVMDFADYGGLKVCGELTLKDLGEAYLDFHARASLSQHNRALLIRSMPVLSNYLGEGFLRTVERNHLGDEKYMGVYLGDIELTEKDFDGNKARLADTISFIHKNVDAALAEINREHPVTRIPTLWEQKSVQSAFFTLADECRMKPDEEIAARRFMEMARAEQVLFYGLFEPALQMLPHDFSELNDELLDQIILETVAVARAGAAQHALVSALSKEEKIEDLGDLQAAADKFADEVLYPASREFIVNNPHTVRAFADSVKRKFRAHAKISAPFTPIRQAFTENMRQFALQLMAYEKAGDTTAELQRLPFSANAALALFDKEYHALSPGARALARIVFAEKDFQTARGLWLRTNTFLRGDAAELKLGANVFAKERLLDKPAKWLRRWLNPSEGKDADKNRFTITENDYRYLNFLAEQIGLVRHEKDPQNVQEMLFEWSRDIDGRQRSRGEIKDLLALYRKYLQHEIFALHRILEMPFRGRTFYQLLAEIPENGPAEPLIHSGIIEVQKNIASHLKRIANVKKIEDLNNYIARSQVLNALLGELDLNAALMRHDFWDGVKSSAEFRGHEEYVFPDLLAYHQQLRGEILQREDLKREMWDEFYETASAAAYPLMALWAIKGFMPFLPRVLGGARFSWPLRYAADKTEDVIDGYWAAILGYIGLNVGAEVFGVFQNRNRIRVLEDLAYTETLALGAPLISESLFQSQMALFKARKDHAVKSAVLGGVLFALPFVSYKGFQYFNKVIIPRRASLKQAKYDELIQAGRLSEAHNLKMKWTADIAARFRRASKSMDGYFRQLHLQPGTWRVAELDAALNRIRNAHMLRNPINGRLLTYSELQQAQEAYNQILREIQKNFAPVYKTPVLEEAFISAIWRGQDDMQDFMKALVRKTK